MSTAAGNRLHHGRPIFLVRHGETTWNRAGRLQGQRDAPLTALGVAQARAAGRTLRHLLESEHPACLMVSPLGRARRSAELLLESLTPLVDHFAVDDRLKEISWGELEGLNRAEVKAKAPYFWRQRAIDRWMLTAPGGESYASLSARLQPVLDELLTFERPAVVVAHGGVRRALRGLYGDLVPAETLALEEPHDVIVRLQAGTMTTLTIE
ncbi:MAG: histidine phosphatase family protein [Geminicoccaceae bacterium]|nr:histidine phosphatase family protein [Geminicoccaceae bacterium]